MADTSDLLKKLKRMAEGVEEGVEADPPPSISLEERMERLKDYVSQPTSYPDGTFVVRNKYGMDLYKYPKAGDVAVVIGALPLAVRQDERTPCTGVIGVLLEKNGEEAILSYAVDMRCYESIKKT